MIFFGGLALLLHLFLAGGFWPHRQAHTFSISLWGYMVKALFISWFWFLLSYYTELGAIAPILVISLSAIALVRFTSGTAPIYISVASKHSSRHFAVFALVSIVLSLPALGDLGSIFTRWDAVVSWNRWAMELSENVYQPAKSAYPVLWPAIWSLIYEAQGTKEVWYIAKASLILPVIFLSFYVADQVQSGRYLSGAFLGVISYSLFFSADQLTSGYMDYPVAVLGFGGLLMIREAIAEDVDQSARVERLLIAAITISLAMLTKQPGMLFAIAFLTVSIFLLLKKEITLQNFALFLAILIIPTLGYLSIYLPKQPSVVGNLDHLTDLAKTRRGDVGTYEYAFKILYDRIPPPISIAVAIGIALNFVFYKSRTAVFGILCFAIGLLGFIAYAHCCSYGWRNGVPLFSFWTMSAWIGVFLCVQQIVSKGATPPPLVSLASLRNGAITILTIFMAAAVGLLIMNIEWPREKITERHNAQIAQELGRPSVNKALLHHKQKIMKYGHLVTHYKPAQYLPSIGDKVGFCHQITNGCIGRHLKGRDRILAFLSEAHASPDTKVFLQNSIQSGEARLLARQGTFVLYEFKSP